jgi:hypothetical protein
MQTCSNCGASVREGARFCTACGTQLNAASSGSSAFSWGAAIEQQVPASHEPVAASSAESPTASGTQEGLPQEEAAGPPADEAIPMSWSWSQPDATLPSEAVDEETGIVLDDPDAEPVDGVVDATELDVLVVDEEDSAPGETDEPAPDLSLMEDEAVSTTPNEAPDSIDDRETIAAWAQEWSSDESPVAPDSAPTDDDDDDPEVTVAKAERLIAELQSLVPRLARPKPVDPNQALIPQRMAEELESATGGTEWEDLREVLVQARDNPNDITYLMKVSGNAGRLLELMEHRNALANTATSVAQRLRNPEPDTKA